MQEDEKTERYKMTKNCSKSDCNSFKLALFAAG